MICTDIYMLIEWIIYIVNWWVAYLNDGKSRDTNWKFWLKPGSSE